MQYLLHRKEGEQFLDENGDPYSGGVLTYFKSAVTPITVYKDASGSTNWGTSVTLDSAGRLTAPIFVDEVTGVGSFKEVFKTSGGSTIFEHDGYQAAQPVVAIDASRPLTAIEPRATSPVTLSDADVGNLQNVDTSGGNVSVVLPDPSTIDAGERMGIRKDTADANTVNIDPAYTEDTYTLEEQHDEVWFICDGVSTWMLDTMSRPGVVRITALTADTNPNPEADYLITRDASASRPKKVLPYYLMPAVLPQGYLTLTSGTPIITGDVAAATNVYYEPFMGGLVPVSDGTRFKVREFSAMTLELVASHAASQIYDVFLFEDSGTMRIGTGPAWATPTAGSGARGTGAGTTQLTRLKGILTNAVSMTVRNGSTTYSVAAGAGVYLGSIFMDGTNGQLTCHRTYGQSRKWGVWNAYNRQPIILKAGDSTASWNYNSTTVRQSRAQAGNTLAVFAGLAEEFFELGMLQKATSQVAAAYGVCNCGIGLNSTTAYSGKVGATAVDNASNDLGDMVAQHMLVPSLGLNNINACESTPTAGGATNQVFFGTEANMILTAKWRG